MLWEIFTMFTNNRETQSPLTMKTSQKEKIKENRVLQIQQWYNVKAIYRTKYRMFYLLLCIKILLLCN